MDHNPETKSSTCECKTGYYADGIYCKSNIILFYY